MVDVERRRKKMHQPPTHSLTFNLLAFLTTVAMETGKQGEQIVPGSDEEAGTWLSESILRGLILHSIFEVCYSALGGV